MSRSNVFGSSRSTSAWCSFQENSGHCLSATNIWFLYPTNRPLARECERSICILLSCWTRLCIPSIERFMSNQRWFCLQRSILILIGSLRVSHERFDRWLSKLIDPFSRRRRALLSLCACRSMSIHFFFLAAKQLTELQRSLRARWRPGKEANCPCTWPDWIYIFLFTSLLNSRFLFVLVLRLFVQFSFYADIFVFCFLNIFLNLAQVVSCTVSLFIRALTMSMSQWSRDEWQQRWAWNFTASEHLTTSLHSTLSVQISPNLTLRLLLNLFCTRMLDMDWRIALAASSSSVRRKRNGYLNSATGSYPFPRLECNGYPTNRTATCRQALVKRDGYRRKAKYTST